jgi:hypothetical protein
MDAVEGGTGGTRCIEFKSPVIITREPSVKSGAEALGVRITVTAFEAPCTDESCMM